MSLTNIEENEYYSLMQLIEQSGLQNKGEFQIMVIFVFTVQFYSFVFHNGCLMVVFTII